MRSHAFHVFLTHILATHGMETGWVPCYLTLENSIHNSDRSCCSDVVTLGLLFTRLIIAMGGSPSAKATSRIAFDTAWRRIQDIK
jgi:hypothetical protein